MGMNPFGGLAEKMEAMTKDAEEKMAIAEARADRMEANGVEQLEVLKEIRDLLKAMCEAQGVEVSLGDGGD